MRTNSKSLQQKSLLNEKNKDLKEALNLSQKNLLDKLNSIDTSKLKVKEKKNSNTKSKDDMYQYSFLFNKYFKLDYSKLSKNEFKVMGQRIRTKIRNKRNNFANNIILYKNNKDIENLKKEINLFDKFYKETFILNDYSLKSISSNNRDADIEILLNSMLNIIKVFK